jgi:hypothetical protein
MGRMQFIVPHRERLPDRALELAYVCNREESPTVTRALWQGDWLVVDRADPESGTFTIPWIVGDRSPVALTTGTLIERARPYLLPLELARGTICRLRTYAFLWPELGLGVPDALPALVKQAVHELATAATLAEKVDRAAQHAYNALDMSLGAIDILCAAYAQQATSARYSSTPRSPILIGTTLDGCVSEQPFPEFLLHACNTIAVPFTWRHIESTEGARDWRHTDMQLAWGQAHELRITGGALVQWTDEAVPDWLKETCDFDTLERQVGRHIKSVVERYRGRVHVWIAAAEVNSGKALPLSEEQRLRLAVGAIEAVRSADDRTPVVLTFDQPWGEYLRDERLQLSPIHFADAIVRGDVGVSALGLRINIGLDRGLTLPRDVLELSRQIDRWCIFNLPLLIELTLPASGLAGNELQQSWINRVVPVLLGKPAVQAVFWGQCHDGVGGVLADRGLFDRDGQPKPAWQAFSSIRRGIEA